MLIQPMRLWYLMHMQTKKAIELVPELLDKIPTVNADPANEIMVIITYANKAHKSLH